MFKFCTLLKYRYGNISAKLGLIIRNNCGDISEKTITSPNFDSAKSVDFEKNKRARDLKFGVVLRFDPGNMHAKFKLCTADNSPVTNEKLPHHQILISLQISVIRKITEVAISNLV